MRWFDSKRKFQNKCSCFVVLKTNCTHLTPSSAIVRYVWQYFHVRLFVLCPFGDWTLARLVRRRTFFFGIDEFRHFFPFCGHARWWQSPYIKVTLWFSILSSTRSLASSAVCYFHFWIMATWENLCSPLFGARPGRCLWARALWALMRLCACTPNNFNVQVLTSGRHLAFSLLPLVLLVAVATAFFPLRAFFALSFLWLLRRFFTAHTQRTAFDKSTEHKQEKNS